MSVHLWWIVCFSSHRAVQKAAGLVQVQGAVLHYKTPGRCRGLGCFDGTRLQRLIGTLVPPPGAPVPLSPVETIFTHSASVPLK